MKNNKDWKNLLIYGAMIVLVGFYMLCNSISDAKSRKEMNAKLDRIASETDAVHSRLDALEDGIEVHNSENGQIVQDLIMNINEVKENVEEEVKRIDKDIKRVEESKKKKKEQQAQAVAYTAPAAESSGYDHPFRSQGRTNDGSWNYTWYSQRVLPGGGLDIPGRHVTEDGFVRDADGNICVASDDLAQGAEVETPYGKGKVYDTGSGSGNLDLYTDW